MTPETWLRHAHPWSGWTRLLTGMPLIILVAWSRLWLGWWTLLPAALTILWLFLNPRLFPPPPDDRAWMTRGVLGERLWAERDTHTIPPHHRTILRALTLVMFVGAGFLIWGLVMLAPWPTALGTTLIVGGKLWYVDRMVWIYEDVLREDPRQRYQAPAPGAASANAS